MDDLRSAILDQLRSNGDIVTPTFYDAVMGFYHAVNWNQRWLQLLLASHVVVLILMLWTRKRFEIQVGIFSFICVCGLLAQPLNGYLKDRWTQFADQDYFDENGLFISVVFSGPLLVIGFIQVISLLVHSSTLMIEAKRAQLKHRMAAIKKKKQK